MPQDTHLDVIDYAKGISHEASVCSHHAPRARDQDGDAKSPAAQLDGPHAPTTQLPDRVLSRADSRSCKACLSLLRANRCPGNTLLLVMGGISEQGILVSMGSRRLIAQTTMQPRPMHCSVTPPLTRANIFDRTAAATKTAAYLRKSQDAVPEQFEARRCETLYAGW